MQKGQHLQFDCVECKTAVPFSIFELDAYDSPLCCPCCKRSYLLDDAKLKRQLKKFESLCRQIADSKEILGNACVGVNVGEHHVKIPYKLLLTRFNSSIDLLIGDQRISIVFRLEPTADI